MQENSTDTNDLSAGHVSQENAVLTGFLISEQQQKARFRFVSYIVAWCFSALFFVSVLAFSWGIMFCPNTFLLTQSIHSGEPPLQPEHKTELTNKVSQEKSSQISSDTSRFNEDSGTLFNQFLLMLTLLSAIGTTLAIAVMRFSFSTEKQSDPDPDATIAVISPLANSISELIKTIVDLIKKK